MPGMKGTFSRDWRIVAFKIQKNGTFPSILPLAHPGFWGAAEGLVAGLAEFANKCTRQKAN
jgi:hypothetical protein